uniref:Uncharacterized protein n=1 Tax=Magallana gigas TaxID=29159 RepID=K1QYB8_MAGGI
MNLILRFLNDITLIPEASEGLQVEKQESEQNKCETDWAARLAIHFFSPLSQTKHYVLDNHGMKKCERCPCSCNKIIRYGDTSIDSHSDSNLVSVKLQASVIRCDKKYRKRRKVRVPFSDFA